MSLKTRLIISIVGLVIFLVVVLSLLNLQDAVKVEFANVLERAQSSVQQVKNVLVTRITEQTAREEPPPQTLEDTKRLWTKLVKEDVTLKQLLTQISATPASVAVDVSDSSGQVISSSDPSRLGTIQNLPNFEVWDKKSLHQKLREILSLRQDYTVPVTLGVGNEPLFTVSVIISSVLLKSTVEPVIQNLAFVSLMTLGLSVAVSSLFATFILRPLTRMNQTIDRITSGEGTLDPPLKEGSREFAAIETKLNLLGQRFQGARRDATQLRNNVEQLFERLEEAVFLFDHDGRLMMAGKPAERMLGKGRWELMGNRLEQVFPPDTPVGDALQEALRLHRPIKDLALSNESAQVLLNVELFENSSTRQVMGTLVTLRDAESRRQIEKELDLSSRMAAISRLTGGVAHEIKNPLNSMALHLEVLKSKILSEIPEGAPEIDVIAREIRRLDRVVKTFLDFTKPIELQMRRLDMAALVSDIVLLVSPSAQKSQVRIETESMAIPSPVRGDPDLLKQAVLNVVVNSVEAMSGGGVLSIRLASDGDDFVLTIADNGPGIPPEIREKIFNLYFSTKKEGSGIGLAMTFQVVQLHNGTIDFGSEPGKGTTFYVRLPAARAAEATTVSLESK